LGNELVAKVALAAATYAIDKPYDYLVPEKLRNRAAVGMRVIVPFGKGNRRSEGLILSLTQDIKFERMKSILTLLDEEPVMDDQSIRLAIWMRDRWFCTLYDAIKAILPSGLWFSLQDTYRIKENINKEEAYLAAAENVGCTRLLDFLYSSGGCAELRQIQAALGDFDFSSSLKYLIKQEILTVDTTAVRGVGDKLIEFASLAVPVEEALAVTSPRKKAAPLRHAVVAFLASSGTASVQELCYYTGASRVTIRSLAKSGILALKKEEIFRRPSFETLPPAKPIVLTKAQQAAFLSLMDMVSAGEPAAALLYGVTGSGKTQVYIRLIEEMLQRGKSAIVLVPEISLTPQLMRLFSSHFGDTVAVLHSSLRTGERYDEWKRIRSGAARVVLGTRSAVFAPCRNLGVIIVDEEQEHTYKSENNPRYDARDIAKYRCVQSGSILLFGSATPSVETMYGTQTGALRKLTLPQRYNEQALPEVVIVDMRKELRAGNAGSISSILKDELSLNLQSGQQSILYLNRRGSSPMVLCVDCGAVPACPRCSVRLTYHSANNRLMCHYCGHSEPLPPICPECGGEFSFIGAGTQRVQEELEKLFPGIEILRMDADTINASCSHEAILTRFERNKVPILLGTQMVTKGLNFDNVTLVGVIAADLSLYLDDYRSGERTFSLLTQVVGRAGRGEKTGRAVIQTFTPKNEVILAAARQDYDGFYRSEVELRRQLGCPPFLDFFVLTVTGMEENEVYRAGLRLRAQLEQSLSAFQGFQYRLLGPAPAPVVKVNNYFRYRLTLGCRNTKQMRSLISGILVEFAKDRKNRTVSAYADLNPEG